MMPFIRNEPLVGNNGAFYRPEVGIIDVPEALTGGAVHIFQPVDIMMLVAYVEHILMVPVRPYVHAGGSPVHPCLPGPCQMPGSQRMFPKGIDNMFRVDGE